MQSQSQTAKIRQINAILACQTEPNEAVSERGFSSSRVMASHGNHVNEIHLPNANINHNIVQPIQLHVVFGLGHQSSPFAALPWVAMKLIHG